MISMLHGTIAELAGNHAIIDVGGLGYKVFMTADALHGLKSGRDIKLWTHQAVREDALDLYGFPTKKDRDFFELLIGISGIGPKSALNILSLVSVETLATSVRTGSVAHLVKVSGIGRKTAEKIVLELKDKLGSLGAGDDPNAAGMTAGMSSDMDAILALQSLGYEADEAREALKKVSADHATTAGKNSAAKELDTSAKVKAALKVLK
jgi:Holliday junction DNA helicase RuvA